jgi:hypothetical protein
MLIPPLLVNRYPTLLPITDLKLNNMDLSVAAKLMAQVDLPQHLRYRMVRLVVVQEGSLARSSLSRENTSIGMTYPRDSEGLHLQMQRWMLSRPEERVSMGDGYDPAHCTSTLTFDHHQP